MEELLQIQRDRLTSEFVKEHPFHESSELKGEKVDNLRIQCIMNRRVSHFI